MCEAAAGRSVLPRRLPDRVDQVPCRRHQSTGEGAPNQAKARVFERIIGDRARTGVSITIRSNSSRSARILDEMLFWSATSQRRSDNASPSATTALSISRIGVDQAVLRFLATTGDTGCHRVFHCHHGRQATTRSSSAP